MKKKTAKPTRTRIVPETRSPAAPAEHITWNIVSRDVRITRLTHEKIRKEIGTLEKHLKRFPIDAVHLHIAFSKGEGKSGYVAALSLRLPSTVLHASKCAPRILTAFEQATASLLRQLVAHKSGLRREAEWKRRKRRAGARGIAKPSFAPEPQKSGLGPQTETDVIRDLAARHYQALRRHVRRLLWHDAMSGEIPWGSIDDRAVVDESIQHALAVPEDRPRDLDFDLWLRHLIRLNLERRRDAWLRDHEQAVSLEEEIPVPESIDEAEGYDAEQPLDIIEHQEEGETIERGDAVADPATDSPADIAARKDLIDGLCRVASKWPAELREIFEMYFVEGLDPEDISLVIGRRSDEVSELLKEVHLRLRETVLDQTML